MKWKFILLFFVIIIILLAVPVSINYLILNPTPEGFRVADPSNGWLNFFAVYFGSVITALVSFVVLHRTIKNNHKENENNRKLQTAILKYQVNKDKINNTKELFARYIYSLDYFGIKSLAKTFDNNKRAYFGSIRQLMENTSIAFQMLDFELADFKDPKEKQYKDSINTFRFRYNDLLMDLLWMLQPYNLKGTDDENREAYIERLNECQAQTTDTENDINRIWNIIPKYDYKVKENCHKIINDCINGFDFKSIETIANDFFEYEKNKNETLINIGKTE